MPKVAIDAGHASNTSGKRTPSGYREHWFNVMVANYIDIGLRERGFQTLKVGWNDSNSKDDSEVSLGERQRQIKNANCDISISIHANASGDGKTYNSVQGVETFIHSNSSYIGDSKNLANCVHSYLIQGTKQTNRGIKSNEFAMCNCKNMGVKSAILIECAFMTNSYEESLIKSESFCKECAEEIIHGICDYFKIPYKKLINTNDRKLYRVQCGAFSNQDNAKRLAEKLNNYGFSTTIKLVNGLYKVQVGAFGNKANAESMMSMVKQYGINATIIYD